jgi:hypothetical protein
MIFLFESSTYFEQHCSAMQPRCILIILVILDHSVIFRVIIPEVVLIQLSSWGWAHSSSKHVDDSNKHIIEEIVRQVGYLPELYEDTRFEKYKIRSVLLIRNVVFQMCMVYMLLGACVCVCVCVCVCLFLAWRYGHYMWTTVILCHLKSQRFFWKREIDFIGQNQNNC